MNRSAESAARAQREATTRTSFREELLAIARLDQRVYCVDSDMGGLEDTFGAEFPERYLNVGIAECAMIGIAAALAAAGSVPFANTMASFASLRAAEFVKVDVADAGVPVKIVATHGGFAGAQFGPTHHCLVDLAVMRSLPNMTVIVPADPVAAAAAARQALEVDGPVYVRLGRDERHQVYDADAPPQLGRASVLRPGNDVALLACGPYPVAYALAAAAELANAGFGARVIDLHTLAPLDTETVVAAAAETAGVVTVEEHCITGGLFTTTAECLARHSPCRVEPIAAPRRLVDAVGTQESLLAAAGITVPGVVAAAFSFLGRSG